LRPFRLRKQQRTVRIDAVDVIGHESLRGQLDQGHGVLIMPNHASHADPYVIYAAADRSQTALHVMATWHVFYDQPWLTRLALRKHGCFSVDREANDIGAFRIATGILQEEREPLVIFPEGEIYHCNERVTPFREGAAAVAVAAARKSPRPIVCMPCAITYRYVEDPTPALLATMSRLEEAIFWRPQVARPLHERIHAFAEALLALKEIEYLGQATTGRLPERIRRFEDHVLRLVEQRHGINASSQTIPERVKAARRTIIEQLEAESTTPATRQSLHVDLEDLFLVVQSFSYPGDYVIAKPSIERMAETLDKFEEDVLQLTTASIKARRTAKVEFGEPLQVSGDRAAKGQTVTLTSEVEKRVQAMLETA
jgi:1-acyl-sn-glycerol-3-phosphate acyltransferase